MLCAACGASLKPGTLFCSKCGASTTLAAAPDVLEAAEHDDVVAAYPPCWSCGNNLKSGARFCPACGALQDGQRIVGDDAASPRQTLRPTRQLILGVSILVLIFAVGGAGAVAWWQFRDARKPEAAAQPASTESAPGPVDAVPVVQTPALPAVDPNAALTGANTTADTAATADAAAIDAATAVAAGRAARRTRRSEPKARPTLRPAAPPRAAAPTASPEPQVLCIRPDGSEVQTSRGACRSQGGVIY